MATHDKPSRTVKTADHVVDILDTLQKLDTATAAEVAENVSLSRSTVHEYLATLEYHGYVVTPEDGRYQLGLRLLDHGMHAKTQRAVTGVAKPALERLAKETEEGARLWYEENGLAIILERVLGDQAVQLHPYDRVGSCTYLHSHSGGKAILAYLPREDIDAIVDRYGLPGQSAETITDRETLYEELESVRQRGVAFSSNESFEGVRSVAAPIIVDDEVVGSISVAGPAKRFQGEFYTERLPELIQGATNEIELEVIHSNET